MRRKEMNLNVNIVALMVGMLVLASGCGGDKGGDGAGASQAETEKPDVEGTPPTAATPSAFAGKPGRTLMVTQSNFAKDDAGKYVVPDSGELLLLQPSDNLWKVERIKDTESNVFHKAIQYDKDTLFTIGANQAMLKLWKKAGGQWTSTTVWNPTFGGKQNRLRDFELADFNKDGKKELAIATHDQGVVAVAWNKDGKWEVEELDRKPNTFVHEIEVGDLDKDGNMEIFATPSEPNTASGVDQGGAILRYAWNGEKFEKSEVVKYDTRHIKEILVADVDGDGTQELYAALEAEMGEKFAIKVPVAIMRYDYKDGKFEATKVMDLDGERFCRFLTAGDIDHDGKNELIAASFSKGVWVIDNEGQSYKGTCIDEKSGGFEHAAYLADMNGDNQLELYVADDNSGSLRQYVYKDNAYESKVIHKRLVPKAAMVWNITVGDF